MSVAGGNQNCIAMSADALGINGEPTMANCLERRAARVPVKHNSASKLLHG